MAAKKTHGGATKSDALSAVDAFEKIKEGNRRFLGHDPVNYPTESERAPYKNGQQPYAAVLSCADSRVSPEIMFNAGLNELFVVRVAGNIADTTSIASIEYAIAHLKTKLIVVVGHESCGAVDAALKNADSTLDLGYNLNQLLCHITPAVASARKKGSFKKNPVTTTVKENARLTANELRSRSSIISNAKDVEIVWCFYHMISGKVDFSDFV